MNTRDYKQKKQLLYNTKYNVVQQINNYLAMSNNSAEYT